MDKQAERKPILRNHNLWWLGDVDGIDLMIAAENFKRKGRGFNQQEAEEIAPQIALLKTEAFSLWGTSPFGYHTPVSIEGRNYYIEISWANGGRTRSVEPPLLTDNTYSPVLVEEARRILKFRELPIFQA